MLEKRRQTAYELTKQITAGLKAVGGVVCRRFFPVTRARELENRKPLRRQLRTVIVKNIFI